MAIFYNYVITVDGNKAKMDKNIYLYKKNKNVNYYFYIKNACFKFEDEINYIIGYEAQFARLRVIKPDGTRFLTDKIPIENGKIKFRVTEDLTDEDIEIGTYTFQIDLYDNSDGFITIPPIYNQFHVLEPLFEENEVGKVDIGRVDVCYLGNGNEEVTIFDDNGAYIKTIWKTGEIITSERMNKIEECLNFLSNKEIIEGIIFTDSITEPIDKTKYWIRNSQLTDISTQPVYENIIGELMDTIGNLQNRLLILEQKIASGNFVPNGENYIHLEDGQIIQLESGEYLELG